MVNFQQVNNHVHLLWYIYPHCNAFNQADEEEYLWFQMNQSTGPLLNLYYHLL